MGAIKEIEHTARNSKMMKFGSQFTKRVEVKTDKSLSRTSLEGRMYNQKNAIVNQSVARDVANMRKVKSRLR
jgi:hypothetical protein